MLEGIWKQVNVSHFVERKKKKGETETEKDTCVHKHTLAHKHTKPCRDLGSITEPEHHTLVWVQCLTQCSLPLGICKTCTHNEYTRTLPNKSMMKCHVAVVTEHEELTEIELSNARLQWLVILMNSPSPSLRKSAVSELAHILLLPHF